MKQFSAITAIISAFVFLGFSMYYDNVDSPENPLPSSYYFIPLWAMVSGVFFALMFNAANGVYRAFFWFFFILSIGNLITEVFFDPLLKTANSYLFGITSIIILINKLKNRDEGQSAV